MAAASVATGADFVPGLLSFPMVLTKMPHSSSTGLSFSTGMQSGGVTAPPVPPLPPLLVLVVVEAPPLPVAHSPSFSQSSAGLKKHPAAIVATAIENEATATGIDEAFR